jgi:hypothetical protein
MAAIGTTTATAIIPPEDRPLDLDDDSALKVASADDLVDEEEITLDETAE